MPSPPVLPAAAAPPTVADAGAASTPRGYYRRKAGVMTALTAWGGTNVVVGGVGALNADREAWRQYHLMTAGWGLVNAALGGFGLIVNRRADRGAADVLADAKRTEKILLLNAGLDVAYVAGGAYLLARARRAAADAPDRDRGWGRAVIVQGAALLAFDLLAYRRLRRGRP